MSLAPGLAVQCGALEPFVDEVSCVSCWALCFEIRFDAAVGWL